MAIFWRDSMNTPIIETERLILRPLTVKDAKAVFTGWATDKEVARFMRWNLHKSIEETIEWLVSEETAVTDECIYNWGFVLKESQRLIGSGGLIYSKGHQMYEIGYALARDCWGKGLATEAAGRIVEFAKDELKVKQLFATHAADNAASGRVLEKTGFIYRNEGTYSSFDGSRTFQSKEYFMNL
jgi:ribosomal-protein-alanine N-acetyltransferase